MLGFVGPANTPRDTLSVRLAMARSTRQPVRMAHRRLPKPSSRRARAELTRERIIAAALKLIDLRGLDALNMRELGNVLGASTMSVYRHFNDKDDLLAAVIDDVIAGFMPTATEGSWRDHAKTMSLTVRNAMLTHAELADLIGREFRRSSISLKVNSEIICRLEASGVPRELLSETYWALACYTTGHALLEAHALKRQAQQPKRRLAPGERARKLSALLRSVEGINMRAIPQSAKVLSRPLDQRQFLFGLESLLDGIEARLKHYKQA